MDFRILPLVDQFLDAHGPFHLKFGVYTIHTCASLLCKDCVLGARYGDWPTLCPVSYLPLRYLPYIYRRWPELYI